MRTGRQVSGLHRYEAADRTVACLYEVYWRKMNRMRMLCKGNLAEIFEELNRSLPPSDHHEFSRGILCKKHCSRVE